MNCRYGDNYIEQEKCRLYKRNIYGRCLYSTKHFKCPLHEEIGKDGAEEMEEIMDELSNLGKLFSWTK